MNQVFAGATALIIGLIIWGFGRKPKEGLIRTLSPKTLEGLNKPEISLVEKSDVSSQKYPNTQYFDENAWRGSKSAMERKKLRDDLRKLMAGNPEERLQAIAIAKQWSSSNVLPILRRGLKDADSRVVIAAASAISKYRGVSNSKMTQENGNSLPPRNVALMR